MRLVKTDEAKPGQRVSRDVVDLRGNVLFKAGTPLSPELLAACKQHTVTHLFIESDAAAEASPAELERKREAILKEVDRMYAGADRAPLMAAFREASKRYLTGRLGGK